MRLAEVSSRLNEVSEHYQVPERVSAATQKVYEGVSAASDAARRGAHAAYRLALDNPRTSIAGMVVAAALVGGLLWYMFGDSKHPVQRRRSGNRVRAGGERRKRGRAARPGAA